MIHDRFDIVIPIGNSLMILFIFLVSDNEFFSYNLLEIIILTLLTGVISYIALLVVFGGGIFVAKYISKKAN